jgi:hypothetical protein
LYFSVKKAGKIQFMRAIRENKVWQQASLADGLPASLQEKFGNGAFSPDGKRFYFTQCSESGFSSRRSSGGGSFCAIYMLQRVANNWSEPVALPEYINLPKANNTHPFIAHQDGKEWLYFASDREGGFGGLDIYRCSRDLGQETSTFSLPQNLGDMINTAGDEVTPFYDTFNNTLWFSSNGQVTLGGLDIFKSTREEGQWLPLENAGIPLNSVADDLFFVKKKSGKGGFWVSNRIFGTQKQQTNNQDIFEFFYKER